MPVRSFTARPRRRTKSLELGLAVLADEEVPAAAETVAAAARAAADEASPVHVHTEPPAVRFAGADAAPRYAGRGAAGAAAGSAAVRGPGAARPPIPARVDLREPRRATRGSMFRKGGESTSVNQGGRRKVHTTYPDGAEMIEEFDLKTDELLVRRRRGRTTLGKDTPWEYLVGEAPRTFAPDTGTLIESGANPSFTRSQDAPGSFVWRVRNLPYPKETYDVRCDHEAQQVVIRTSNKKYFKRFEVPELKLLACRETVLAAGAASALQRSAERRRLTPDNREVQYADNLTPERAETRHATTRSDDIDKGDTAQALHVPLILLKFDWVTDARRLTARGEFMFLFCKLSFAIAVYMNRRGQSPDRRTYQTAHIQ